ncbi:hypothetical protein JIX55_30445 [Streptomyces sp. DSM 40750]|nr:hypothetical protein [Streptomyces sp. DSM 40750]UUU28169.1 hypothetical protein JIX55_30445 [Streptomyces sp. DSM 40750]
MGGRRSPLPPPRARHRLPPLHPRRSTRRPLHPRPPSQPLPPRPHPPRPRGPPPRRHHRSPPHRHRDPPHRPDHPHGGDAGGRRAPEHVSDSRRRAELRAAGGRVRLRSGRCGGGGR